MTLEAAFALRAGTFHLDVALECGPGITVLFGPSGSGKSLTLLALAGLVTPLTGRIAVDGTVLYDSTAGISVPPHRRGIGYVSQSAALFPHLDAADNVAFGIRGLPRRERRARAAAWLARLDLTGFERRRPGSLSGGQAQRVALARALAPGHRLLLLDEPFSALDEALRQGSRHLLIELAREQHLTILFVTHDLREAHLLADRLVVLDRGAVLQEGARDEVFRAPRCRQAALLLGAGNVFPATVVGRDERVVEFEAAGWRACAASWVGDPRPGDAVDVTIRPERVVFRRGEPAANGLLARIDRDFDYGAIHELHCEPTGPGPRLVAELAVRPYEVLGVASRREWLLELPPEQLHVMPAEPASLRRSATTQ